MKHYYLTLFAIVASIPLFAADFEVDGFAYNILDAKQKTVEVVSTGGKDSGEVTIPSNVTYRGITFSVTSMGCGFRDCKNLTSINLPEGITEIGQYSFWYCNNLTSIKIPSNVTYIGYEAFYYCTKLSSLTIPSSVTEIAYRAFLGCWGIKKLYITDIASWCNITVSDYGSLSTSDSVHLYVNNQEVENLIIPSEVKNIRAEAFSCCSYINSVTFHDSITSIGDKAFRCCYNLTSLNIPSSVTSIGSYAFVACTGLETITIPNSISSIEANTFSGCSNLKSISLPNIISSIGASAFSECSSLTSITIPNSISSIEANTFSGCSNLKSISLPNSISSIGTSAFSGCSSLKSITIPGGVTSIGNEAFSNCPSLDTLVVKCKTPPTISSNTFAGVSKFCTIIVPCGSLESYQNAANWSSFLFIQEAETFPYAVTVTSADSLKGTAQVDVQADCDKDAIISAKAKEGFTFSQWSDGNKENPRSLTLTNDVSLTAYFNPTQCVVKVLSDVGGTVTGNDTVPYNSVCTISATPNKYHHFLKWSDGSTANPRSVVVKQDTCFTAIFEHDELQFVHYTIINESPYGTMSVTGEAVKGSTITLNAIAPECSKFVRWSDSRSAPNPRTVTLRGDATFTAIFEKIQFNITLETEDENKGEVNGE